MDQKGVLILLLVVTIITIKKNLSILVDRDKHDIVTVRSKLKLDDDA